MEDWEGGVRSWDETANLGHDCHQSERPDVGAFAAHVASSDDLESGLLRDIRVIGDVLFSIDLFTNRVPAILESKRLT